MRLIFLPFEESSYVAFARSKSGLFSSFMEPFSHPEMCIFILQFDSDLVVELSRFAR